VKSFDSASQETQRWNEPDRLETLNVNNFCKILLLFHKKIKPFTIGISHVGVWRQIKASKGSTDPVWPNNYDDLFADPMAWMEHSWVDYILPQLYGVWTIVPLHTQNY
jgi:uncharacterized lipoprotein YddW (UPF0748 family)